MRHVGIDETATKRGQAYITLLVDLDTSRLLFATEGRDASTVEPFRECLKIH